jgi:hypothetical protein
MAYMYTPKPEDNPNYGVNPDPGVVIGTILSTGNAISFGLTSGIIDLAERGLDTSPSLSKEEFNRSEYKRPGLEFHNGVNIDSAKRAAERYDAKLEYQQTVGAIDNSFLRGTSQFVGSSVGFALDISNLFFLYKVPMLTLGRAAPYLAKLAEKPLAATAAKVGVGFGEGVAIMAPQEAATFAADKFYGEDPGLLHPLINLGLAGVLGGVVRGVFGFKEPITANADNIAKQTAVNQLSSGKSVRVNEIMQHGAYEADVRAKLREQENLAASNERVLQPLENKLRATAEESFLSGLQASREALLPLAGEKLKIPEVRNLKTEIRGLRENINNIDKKFDDYLAAIREEKPKATYKEAVAHANKAIEHDKKPLQDALTAAETRLRNHETASAAEADLTRLDQSIAHAKQQKTLLDKEFLKNFNDLFNPLLINKPISKKRIISGDYNLSDLGHPTNDREIAYNAVRNNVQEQVANVLLEARETKPLTADQIKLASEEIQSYKSDSAYVEAESKAFRSEVEALPGELEANLKHAEERVKTLEEKLPDDIKKDLAVLREASNQTEKVNNALQKIIDCLRGE